MYISLDSLSLHLVLYTQDKKDKKDKKNKKERKKEKKEKKRWQHRTSHFPHCIKSLTLHTALVSV